MLRPVWRGDLKWVFGLVCLLSVLVASLVYSGRSLTERETATGIFRAAVGGFASEQISDEEWRSLQAEAAADPDGAYTVPGFKTEIPGLEIVSLTKDEAVAAALAPVAAANYEEGPEAAESMLDLEEEDGGEFTVGPLSALTRENHDALRPALIVSLVVAFVSGTLLFAFSRGPGRAGAVGFVVALGTAGFALVWSLISDAAAGVSSDDGLFAQQLGVAVSTAAGDLSGAFLRIFVLTAAMVAFAVAFHFGEAPARRLWNRYRRGEKAAPGGAADEDTDAGEFTPGPGPAPRPSLGSGPKTIRSS